MSRPTFNLQERIRQALDNRAADRELVAMLTELQGLIDGGGGGGPDVVETVELAHTTAFTTTANVFVPVTGFSLTYPSAGDWLVMMEAEVASLSPVVGNAGAEARLTGTIDLDGPITPTRQVILRNQPEIKSLALFGKATGVTAGQTVQVSYRRGAAVFHTVYMIRGRILAIRRA